MFISDYSVVISAVQLVSAVVVILLCYIWWSHQYWKRRNVPQLEPQFPIGHSQNPLKINKSIGILMKQLYDQIKSKGLKYCGIYFYTTPLLYVVDPDLLRYVLAVDFQNFTDRGAYYNEKGDPLSAHLFAIEGPKWRKLRHKLTPTFTSGKMKLMFQTLIDCGQSLTEALDEYCGRQEPVDSKEVFARFTTDVIGSCAFGLECNSFKDQNSPFRIYGKKMFDRDLIRMFLFMFARSYPGLARLLNVKDLPTDVAEFFMRIVKNTVEYREQNHISQNDFLQILLELKNNPTADDSSTEKLTMNELAAQCLVFFAAGFETSSTTMTFATYELARNQEIQQKVRDEIGNVLQRNGGQLTYDVIGEMKYLNQVIDETLRRYPPGALVTRVCVKDYKFPKEDVVIQKGTRIVIPILGLHLDPEYHPEPLKFDPERFSEQNKSQIRPFTYLPFGEGPRNCIGLRFALMETKVGLISLIRNYRFTVNRKTIEPLKMDPYAIIQSAQGDIWLDVKNITI